MNVVNLAAYRFVSLSDLALLRAALLERSTRLNLRGTIVLAPEGINLFIAGTRAATGDLIAYLQTDALFEGKFAALPFKESLSQTQPFKRMLVKLKKEIITMNSPAIRPEAERAPSVDAQTLKRWLDRGQDDASRPVVLLDTRNAFEVDLGTFSGAVNYRLGKFSEFPTAVAKNLQTFSGKTVVSFCTGGIRCEKAAIHMRNIGIEQVYQLDGGILKYFEETGGAHYQGDCFVFDARAALDCTLQPALAKRAATRHQLAKTPAQS
jgi:UPF0176 protein